MISTQQWWHCLHRKSRLSVPKAGSKENMEIYSPLRETDECNITASDKSAMFYTGTMGVPNIRQGNFCSDGDTKTRNEAQIRTDIACATGEYNRNQGHKGIHETLRNPGDNKCNQHKTIMLQKKTCSVNRDL